MNTQTINRFKKRLFNETKHFLYTDVAKMMETACIIFFKKIFKKKLIYKKQSYRAFMFKYFEYLLI